MKLDDDFEFGTSKTGAKTHIVDFDESTPSMLILGSDAYEVGTHFRAACGTISEFDGSDEPDDRSGYCYPCVRAAIARGIAVDPDPFDPDDATGRERHTSDRHQS